MPSTSFFLKIVIQTDFVRKDTKSSKEPLVQYLTPRAVEHSDLRLTSKYGLTFSSGGF